MKISYFLEKNMEQEITETMEWQMEYSIPFFVLNKYIKVEKPGPELAGGLIFRKVLTKLPIRIGVHGLLLIILNQNITYLNFLADWILNNNV